VEKILHFQIKRRPPALLERGLGAQYQINALDKKNHSNEKRLRTAGSTNEVEVKQLKLMFLLMMSLGQYRTPVH
jgi:hypothetical protein